MVAKGESGGEYELKKQNKKTQLDCDYIKCKWLQTVPKFCISSNEGFLSITNVSENYMLVMY